VLDIASQVGSALAAAHAAGIVHRDIKPENIMLRRDGYVKVLDFGQAKLTEQQLVPADAEAPTLKKADTTPGLVMGTIKYMSPEQARGFEVDVRSDIFSFGVVFYEMIAGRAPFEGETTSDLIAALLKEDPARLTRYAPTTPDELQRLISKALRKKKDDRYQTIPDLLIDLKGLRQEKAVTESRVQPSTQTINGLGLSTREAKAATIQ
jgi:serine/threonine protein kinase